MRDTGPSTQAHMVASADWRASEGEPLPAGVVLRRRFAENLRRLRRDRGLTQDQVAHTARLSINFYGKLERGELSPSFATLEVLAEVLSTDPSAFFQTDSAGSRQAELMALLGSTDDPGLTTDVLAIVRILMRRLRPAG